MDVRGSLSSGFVIDLGVSEGNDTEFYLAKGFEVIGVEADPIVCERLRDRFQQDISSGAFRLLNFAAGRRLGEAVEFHANTIHQGVSGIAKRAELSDEGYRTFKVPVIDWRTLLAQRGMPRYLKIDIEGGEQSFLEGMLEEGGTPEFMSVECYKLRPCEMLHEMGYERFKLIDQNPPGGFQLPPLQLEGRVVRDHQFVHSSGPFGLDLFGRGEWMTFAEFKDAWTVAEKEFGRTWFDCHAWRPN